MNPSPFDDESLQPLVDEVTEGRAPSQEELEQTAAAVHAALLTSRGLETAPPKLRQRLRADLDRLAAPPKEKILQGIGFRSGWLAAAACLALTGYLWLHPRTQLANSGMVPLAQVLAAGDVIRVVFNAPGAASDQSGGEVIWSTSLQSGYLRLRGLARNESRRSQYQLWIVDPLRDPTYPVDGGVFDFRGEEVLVPIQAKLGIYSPHAFVITTEQPGGIVKSRADKPVLLAQVK